MEATHGNAREALAGGCVRALATAAALVLLAVRGAAQVPPWPLGPLNPATPLKAADFRAPIRKALIIGNTKYQAAMPLRNPVNDATDLGVMLGRYWFQVDTLLDGTREQMDRVLDNFVENLRPGDVVLFSYHGHAFQSDGENYLVPVDCNPTDEISARSQSVAVSPILERITKTGARLTILVLDACRDNPFAGRPTTLRTLASRGLARMLPAEGSFIAYATLPGKAARDVPADDATSRNSLFAQYLLETIPDPSLKLGEVFDRTREKVVRASSNEQRPVSISSVVGDFYFARPDEIREPEPGPEPVRTAQVWLDQGRKLEELGDLKGAMTYYDKSLETRPRYPEALLARGSLYRRLDKPELALPNFSRALELEPDSFEALLGRGALHNQLQQPQRAVEDCQRAMKLAPGTFDVVFCLGSAYHQLGQHAAAIQHLTAALRLKPDHFASLYLRGESHRAQRRCWTALADFSGAIRSKPEALDPVLGRGICYQELNQHKEALADLTQVARGKPNDAQVRYLAALSYFALRQTEEAAKSLQEALRVVPDSVEALHLLGLCHMRMEQYKPALDVLTRAIELRQDPAIFLARSEVFLAINNQAAAGDDRMRAKKLILAPH